MDLGLKGKVAIVTGGSSGIGLATARLFLQDGAAVAIVARGEDRLKAAAENLAGETGGTVYSEPLDVRDRAAVEGFTRHVAERFGGIDCLVNNAGGGKVSTFASTTDEDWRHELDLKFFGIVNPTRACVPFMKERGGGRIVVVNAILARQPEPHMVATSAARAGVLNLTRSLAHELAPDNILVNTVALGVVESEQWRRRYNDKPVHPTEQEYFQSIAEDRGVHLRRMGRPEEVAGMIVFLCSSYASYITGATIDIGGGVHHYV